MLEQWLDHINEQINEFDIRANGFISSLSCDCESMWNDLHVASIARTLSSYLELAQSKRLA